MDCQCRESGFIAVWLAGAGVRGAVGASPITHGTAMLLLAARMSLSDQTNSMEFLLFLNL